MSPIIVKPIDEFTFEDAQLATPLYIGEKVDGSKIQPAKMWGDDNVTTSMNIEANISKRKYEVFVRKVESPKEETKFRGFLNTNLNANTEGWIYVWVILGAKDIKEANESFKNFIKDKSIRDSKKDNAIKNDPIVIKEKAAGGDMVVLMRTVREIKYKSGAGALLHPAEEYFVERATTTTTH